MKKYRRLKSIYSNSMEKKLAVDLYDWAELALAEEEYDQFKSETNELFNYYEQQISLGNIIVNTIFENVSIEDDIILAVGEEYIVPDDFIIPANDTKWHDRMSIDPNIVKYNSLELLSE